MRETINSLRLRSKALWNGTITTMLVVIGSSVLQEVALHVLDVSLVLHTKAHHVEVQGNVDGAGGAGHRPRRRAP